MIRSHGSVVVYGEELALRPESVEKFDSFSQWLTNELAILEARWNKCAPLLARTLQQQSIER